MNLSVESRVKAHISTPYIDADGRGVEGAYAMDYADCMKPPEEFKQILNGGGKDDALLRELESHCSALVERSKAFRKAMDDIEAQRQKGLAAEAAAMGGAIAETRDRQMEEARHVDSANLDAAYHKRLESDLDMDRYMRMLVKSDEAKVRDHEESVASRHSRLKSLAAAAKASQRAALDDDARKKQHLEGIRERIAMELAAAEQQKEAAELAQQQLEELQSILQQHAREGELRQQQTLLRASQEAESMSWAAARDRAIAATAFVNQCVVENNKKLAQLRMSEEAKLESEQYDLLKDLQSAFESRALAIQRIVKDRFQVGSFLERLMQAAKVTAEKDKHPFHGLSALLGATMAPSSLTPLTKPTFDGPQTRSVAVLTTVSEPLRPPSNSSAKRK